MAANEAPLTSSAGKTSRVFFHLKTGEHHIQRQDQGEGRQDPSQHGVEGVLRQSGDSGEHADRVADSTPGYRCRVGDQANDGRLKWGKSQADEKRSGMATGAPPPPVPSRNAPKQNAIKTVCTRTSREREAIDCFITSNCPVSSEML